MRAKFVGKGQGELSEGLKVACYYAKRPIELLVHSLCAVRNALPKGDVVASMSSAPASRATSTQPGVLIVESDVLVRTAVAAYLRECGYRIVEVANSAEAKEVLRSDMAIDIVFTVVELPDEHDGFALARWVRREWPDLKVILASGVARAAAEAGEICEHGP
ncbi:MAG: response regulator, partial [Alphaproteobacteria bacterium]|nr:response regulator [Alphaproteobacteria bacterium]